MHWTTWIGVIVGVTVGIAGGVIGTWATVRSAQGPRERAFVIKVAIGFWALIGLFLIALFKVPHPLRMWLWMPYVVILPMAILKCNRRQAQIRREEEEEINRLRNVGQSH